MSILNLKDIIFFVIILLFPFLLCIENYLKKKTEKRHISNLFKILLKIKKIFSLNLVK